MRFIPDRIFYSERDLDAMGILSQSTRWRCRREGTFPEPVEISRGRKAYRADEIQRWVNQRMEGRADAA